MLLASDGVVAKKTQWKKEKKEERNIVAIRAHSYYLCMKTIMQTLTHLPACTEQTSALCMYIETLKMPLASIHPPPLLPGIWRGGGSDLWCMKQHDTPTSKRSSSSSMSYTHSQSPHPRLGHKSKQATEPAPFREGCGFMGRWCLSKALFHTQSLVEFTLIVDTHSLSLSLFVSQAAFGTEALGWLISLMHSGRLPNQRASNTDKRALQCSVWWKTANLRFL